MVMIMVVVMIMIVVRVRREWRGGATLAVHPARITADVMFFLPNRDAVLHFVDDVATGTKCFVAVWCAHAHPYGDRTERQIADAMHAACMGHTEARAGLGDDAFALAYR